MHSEQIAKVLQSLAAFGKRVGSLVLQNPTAQAWWINRDILVQRRHWLALSQSVMNLVRLLGFHVLDDHAPPPLRPWPDYDMLRAAAMDAARIFGPAGGPDRRCPFARPGATRPGAGEGPPEYG